MVEWLSYVVRAFAAVTLGGVSAVFLILAVTTRDARAVSLALGCVFALAGAFTWPRRPNAWQRDPPTDRQLAYARDLGITIRRGVSKGELSDLIGQAKAARDEA
jgi:hypothetical protein